MPNEGWETTRPLNAGQHLESEKTHSKKRMTQANILGTRTILKHEHWMNTSEKENQDELIQTELYKKGSKWTISTQQH